MCTARNPNPCCVMRWQSLAWLFSNSRGHIIYAYALQSRPPSDPIGKETKRLFGKIDGKVWKLIANPTEPHIYVDPNDQHDRLSSRYTDGFPDEWKTSDDAVKRTIASFRAYARFWYHIIYDSSPGSKLGVHLTDLPEDHPKSELSAFEYVGRLSKELPPSSPLPTPLGAVSIHSTSVSPGPPHRSTVPPSDVPVSEFKEAITTKFPARIRADRLVSFDGKPQRIFTVDLSVEDMCGEHNYPGYYGGTVVGSAEDGYKYVEHDAPGGAPNYQFGSLICSAITSRFVDDAAVWWEDYRQAGGAKPNCWKTSAGCGVPRSCPPGTEEVSLFDILTRDFPAENDVSEAKLELSRLKWNAGSSDVMPFATFRNKSTALAKRAGYIGWEQQCPVIRECIEPYSLRKAVQIYDSADTFWFHTGERQYLVTRAREHSEKGHYKSECIRLKNQISRGEVPADERNKRGGPSRAAPVQSAAPVQVTAPLPQNRFPSRTALPRPMNANNARSFNCRNCGGSGHAAAVCPSAKKAAVAATNLVDDNARDSDDDDVAQYVMSSWMPGRNLSLPGDRIYQNNEAAVVSQYEGIDELFSTFVANTSVDFPLFNNISTPVDKNGVIADVVGKPNLSTVVKVSDSIDMTALGPPSGDVPSGP
ncbi:hypothetical protein EDC01DRAFT_626542 [Geopyxis carbonaria]|nr:hypothetical protein EDC01DRAFT_626542 [Geopyxis carbonaria]